MKVVENIPSALPSQMVYQIYESEKKKFHQGRSDRDDYLKILYENVKSDNAHNFKKYEPHLVTHFDLPYDYDVSWKHCIITSSWITQSILHYGNDFFGKESEDGSRKITIETKDPTKQETIGQRTMVWN